jgi:hypothetical protein
MPDPNRFSEGLEYIESPANMGNNLAGIDSFPDSLAATYGGGFNELYFTGKDAYGARVYPFAFPAGPSGNFDSASPIYGLSGIIFRPLSPDTPDAGGRTSPLVVTNARASGWGRLGWEHVGNRSGQIHYNPGTPNLRADFEIPIQDPCFPLLSQVATGYNDFPPTGTGMDTENRSILSTLSIGVLDLVSEGPIEGFVTGDYIYNTSGRSIGDIGYTDVRFAPYITTTGGTSAVTDVGFKGAPEARSIYWNDTPVSTNKGYLNFQYTDFRYSYGEPCLHTVSSPKIFLYEDRYHWDGNQVDQFKYPICTTVSKDVQEPLIGGNKFNGPASGFVFPKRFYIYDTDIAAVKIGLKINALYTQILTGEFIGETRRKSMDIRYRLYRLFNDKSEVIATTEDISPDKPELYTRDAVSYYGKIVTNPMLVHYTFWMRPYADHGATVKVYPNQIGWVIDVEKASLEAPYQYESNTIEVNFMSYIYGDRFIYPNTAMVYSQYDARYFSSIPSRTYLMKLLKVKVPSNYDPIKKTYSGAWNGKFKLAWTDNPAWCYYDMLTNNRFGLGKYINADLVDKWSLYEISQYCDTLVPDGFGGLEPRFTCNLYITTKAEAYKVLNDMASIFNGLPYYLAGQIFTTQDRPKEPIYIFNNSNIINGEFTYSDSSRKARRSVALVRFNDEFDNYKPAIEYVEDPLSIKRYGIRETEVAAFGATRRSQARRLGKWMLASENYETELINFDVGLEGHLLRPGDVISVQDQNRSTRVYAGRTLDLSSGTAVLDIPANPVNMYILTGVNSNFNIAFLTPTYNLYPGTSYGNDYISGNYGITSTGASGINSQFYRKSQIQELIVSPASLYIKTGDNYYSGYVSLQIGDLINTSQKFTPNISSTIRQTGDSFAKVTLDGWGDSQVFSTEGYNRNVFAQASPGFTDKYVMFALNSDPNTDANYPSLDYAFYYVNNGTINIWENNVNQVGAASGLTYTTNTACTIEYDGEHVNYYSGTKTNPKQNFLRKTARVFDKNSNLHFDSSFYSIGAELDDVKFGVKGLYTGQYYIPQNTVWTIDVSTTGNYGGINSGIEVRYEAGNALYPGWYLEPYLDRTREYRVTNVVEKEGYTFQVTALEYNPLKYADIDSGLSLAVPRKDPIPLTPAGGVSIIFRSSSGTYAPPASTTRFTTNQNGVNSVLVSVTGNVDSGIVSQYYLYVKSGSDFITEPGAENLVSVYPIKPLNNLFLVSNTSLTGTLDGSTHAFFTPTVTGDYYVRLYAENRSRERSSPLTGQATLTNQTAPSVVIAFGVGVL